LSTQTWLSRFTNDARLVARPQAAWLAFTLLLATAAYGQQSGQILAGYYPSWETGQVVSGTNVTFGPASLDPNYLSRLNLLIYAFADINGTTCQLTNPTSEIVTLGQLKGLKSTYPKLRILLSLGGAPPYTGAPSPLDAPTANGNAANFAQSCMDNVITANPGVFDGVDIDWEYPTASDTGSLTALVTAFRSKLNAYLGPGAILTATLGIGSAGAPYQAIQFSQVVPQIDYFTLMAYDTAAANQVSFNAPLYQSDLFTPGSFNTWNGTGDSAAQDLINNAASKIPAAKLILGTPMYGIAYASVPSTDYGLYYLYPGAWANYAMPTSYSLIKPNITGNNIYCDFNGSSTDAQNNVSNTNTSCTAPANLPSFGSQEVWIYNIPNSPAVPGITSGAEGFITFDNATSEQTKVRYTEAKQMGGIAAWQLQQDMPTGGLMASIASAMGNSTAAVAPTADQVNPSSGTGASQTFTFNFSSVRGSSYLKSVAALINTGVSTSNACQVQYVPASNELYVVSDSGSLLGPLTPGGGGSESNNECTLTAAGSSVYEYANTLKLSVEVIFASGFTGAKNVYGDAVDNASLNSGWVALGTWTVTSAVQNTPPAVGSVTPSSGAGASQNFTFSFSSVNGYGYLNTLYTLINGSESNVSGCRVEYVQSGKRLYLYNDAGSGVLGPVTLGAGTLSNSQCTLNSAGSSVSGSGDTLSLTLALSFTQAFAGVKNVYAYALDNAHLNSGWKQVGTWQTMNLQIIAPTVTSVSPDAGAGASQNFTFNFASVNGSGYVNTVYALINTTETNVSGCRVEYVQASKRLYLYNDAGSGVLGPVTLGAGTLSNSQCTLNSAASSVSGSGDTLSLTLALSFTPAFAGAKNVYAYALDNAHLSSGWEKVGTWQVQ
jgi:GH18 family chitinase